MSRQQRKRPAPKARQHSATPDYEPLTAAETQQVETALLQAWPRALRHWSSFLLLGDPVEDSTIPSIAQIHLGTRQVTVNGEMIIRESLLDSVEAILAHEVGHHVRYPGNLRTLARLRTLERPLLPGATRSVVNLFTDLLINQTISRDPKVRSELAAVYQAFSHKSAFHEEEQWKGNPLFMFYLGIYEELWRLPPGSIIGPALNSFEQQHPRFRLRSQLVAQNLFQMGPNVYTQFLYFLSCALRYLEPAVEDQWTLSPYACQCGEPSPDDWADALNPNRRERVAIGRALTEGWFPKSLQDALEKLKSSKGRIESQQGTQRRGASGDPLVCDTMAAWYRGQAEIYLLRPPPQRRVGDAIAPTTTEDWELGDSPREIDWTTTLLERGSELGAIAPLKRSLAADNLGFDVATWHPRMEIYLDVSGSMPNPQTAINSMTLAAQILTLGTTREGGSVRAALYSSETEKLWKWCRSFRIVSAFLMQYIGGATLFPFELLEASMDQCSDNQPIRVVISDRDFDVNYRNDPRAEQILRRASSASQRMVLLQHRPEPLSRQRFRAMGVDLVEVHRMDDFPKMATELTRSLFPTMGMTAPNLR